MRNYLTRWAKVKGNRTLKWRKNRRMEVIIEIQIRRELILSITPQTTRGNMHISKGVCSLQETGEERQKVASHYEFWPNTRLLWKFDKSIHLRTYSFYEIYFSLVGLVKRKIFCTHTHTHTHTHTQYIYIYIYIYIWTPTYGRAKAGRPARTYIQQLCEDTGCSPEDLPEAMNDWGKWRERVRDIRASGATWW